MKYSENPNGIVKQNIDRPVLIERYVDQKRKPWYMMIRNIIDFTVL